jgi:carboxyl-terminal processing protease
MAIRSVWLTGGLLAIGVGVLWAVRPAPEGAPAGVAPTPAVGVPPFDDRSKQAPGDDPRSHAFQLPSGRAPSLTCEEARAIVAQARSQLSHQPDAVDPRALAGAAADWFDPYGLWSVAPDTPVATAFDRHAVELLADLEGRGSRDCRAARALGTAMIPWVAELRAAFDDARANPPASEDASVAVSSPVFEGAFVTRPARAHAVILGRRLGTIEPDYAPAVNTSV